MVTVMLVAGAAATSPAVAQGPARIVQPGAPGQPTRTISASDAADVSAVRHTAADVRFMQGMSGHHAQALEMTALVATRSVREDLRTLALRIEVSQADEMAMMKEWLTQRGEPVPDGRAHHGHDATRMPGMLTADQMQRLRDTHGTAFEAGFLEGMIQHHLGALVMVRELFATPGAGQEPALFSFASDVEADQAMEIRRMRALLKELQK